MSRRVKCVEGGNKGYHKELTDLRAKAREVVRWLQKRRSKAAAEEMVIYCTGKMEEAIDADEEEEETIEYPR